MARMSQPKDDDEMRKRITALAPGALSIGASWFSRAFGEMPLIRILREQRVAVDGGLAATVADQAPGLLG